MKANLIQRMSVLMALLVLLVMSLPTAGAFAAGTDENKKEIKSEKAAAQVQAVSRATTDNKTESSGKKALVSSETKMEVKSANSLDGELETDLDLEAGVEDSEGNEVSNDEVNANKSTQIHLHLNKCLAPVEQGFVLLNGEWQEMTNPGSSPLYKLFDDGEYVKDDIEAFKLVFTGGEELVVEVSDLKIGVEAEGTVNYWIDECAENPDENLLIGIQLNIDHTPGKIDRASLVMMDGRKTEFKMENNMFTIALDQKTQLEKVRGVEISSDGKTKLVILNEVPKNIISMNDGILTVQLNWSVQGTMVGSTPENDPSDSSDEKAAVSPVNNSNGGSASASGESSTADTQGWSGDVLPQTGEESRMMFYILGLLVSAAGLLLGFKNPLRN